MRFDTTRFGEVEVDEKFILDFIEPLFGYEEFSKYAIIEHNGNEVFQWLQSVESPEVAFPISKPGYFNIQDYIFELDDEKAEKLGVSTADDIMVYNIVTIPVNNPKGTTMNLLGPIVINTKNNKAIQYVLLNKAYSSHYPLFEAATV